MSQARRRPGRLSLVVIATSIGLSVAVSVAMDVILLSDPSSVPVEIAFSIFLFNVTVILLSGVGGVIEWRRPGHAIGRLLMVSGPLYAFLGMSWLTSAVLEPLVEPRVYQLLFWVGSFLSWPGVAVIVGWIPLLFPTGTLPGPRWRIPAVLLGILFGVSLLALAAQSFPALNTAEPVAPAGLVTAVSLEMLALMMLAAAAVIARYRRGDPVERVQIRWLGAAVAICVFGFVATAIQSAVQTDEGPLVMMLVLYMGILALPISIGVAVTRYRLYEIDRIISRTIGWAVVTGVLVTVFAGAVIGIQAALTGFTQGQTFAVAASTLVAFALFQPVRRRVQHVLDRRFDRARYDGDRTAAAFAERMRDKVDLVDVVADLAGTVGMALRPSATGLWIRTTSRSSADQTTP